jgi:hypothetical protein
MEPKEALKRGAARARCCPCETACDGGPGIARREFLSGGLALALSGVGWRALAETVPEEPEAPPRAPLTVQPVLMYEIPTRQPQTSWRSWGGIQTRADADAEVVRIRRELAEIEQKADFPVAFRPPLAVRGAAEIRSASGFDRADAVLVYAAGGGMDIFDAVAAAGKPMILFLRHRSGPVSLWYEIVSPRYLRQHTDRLSVTTVDHDDIVVDSPDELTWRLRALCGLKNARGARIVAVGGPSGWATPRAPELARTKFGLDIRTLDYAELGGLIRAARADGAEVALTRERAARYLEDRRVKLETKRPFVENAFLLERIFRSVMARAECRAITINGCMSTIMPMAETTACLTLSLLNDAGYLAFCESDFVVIPSGLLLAGISGRPQFLNDPTYPHQGVITLAHCTGPRRMDGRTVEAARLVTHFESDYGAAPKVEMRRGQKVTSIIPDFACERWTGFAGTIADAPFLPICRTQIDVAYTFPDERLARNMPGFHWMTCYGDYVREIGCALKRIPVEWMNLAAA